MLVPAVLAHCVRIPCFHAPRPSTLCQAQVVKDMELQQDWAIEIHPEASMLKCRMPYKKGQTQYLDGHIYFPIWGGRTTSETRLVVTRKDHYDPDTQEPRKRMYDHKWYEDLMFHFNTVTRTTYFPHDITLDEGEGLDHCFDCASEIFLIQEYLRKHKGIQDPDTLKKETIQMSRDITRECSSSGRSLLVSIEEKDEKD